MALYSAQEHKHKILCIQLYQHIRVNVANRVGNKPLLLVHSMSI